jgi:hypothetical protein
MFINSSNATRSKILQAAIEIDEDYRDYIQKREKYAPKVLKNKSM